jgi:methylenetetrahydrofolate dehydrogenase (NADP+) / methenyltetrahydrofolate cyclohydrolase
MTVDGKAIAKEILSTVKERLQGRTLTVRIVSMAPTPVTESYLRIKERAAGEAGMCLEVVRVENDATTEDVLHKVLLPGADAVVVQLPLPPHIKTPTILDAIPFSQDADMLSDKTTERYEEEGVVPPVAEAVREVFERYNVETADKKAVVVGEGKLVGKPVAALLHKMGAQVLTMNIDTWHPEHLKDADIVVTGAGKAGLIQPEMLKEGVVLIDAGASESEGSVKGDADPSCAEVASLFTPVPGGMGPIVVACLFKNVATLNL